MTVLFADLSGYTADRRAHGPRGRQGAGRPLPAPARRGGRALRRHGRQVHRRQRDGALRRAGRPRGRRRAGRARRAGDAGRRWRRSTPTPPGSTSVDFALRVGLNTGEVLAGPSATATPSSATPSTWPSRLQAAGRPGAVTVGERTVRATRDASSTASSTPLDLKGKAEPVPAWEAVGVLAAQPVRRAPAPREAPLRRPRRRAGRARVGLRPRRARGPPAPRHRDRPGRRRQVAPAARVGERAWRAPRPAPAVREGRCLPYGSGVVYWALGEVLRAECRIVDGDAPTWPGRSSRSASASCSPSRRASPGRAAERKAALIARLLGIELPAGRRRPEVRRPRSACARRSSPRCARSSRRWRGARPARARVRGHPLGRRRHARPDRVPRAVGARRRC